MDGNSNSLPPGPQDGITPAPAAPAPAAPAAPASPTSGAATNVLAAMMARNAATSSGEASGEKPAGSAKPTKKFSWAGAASKATGTSVTKLGAKAREVQRLLESGQCDHLVKREISFSAVIAAKMEEVKLEHKKKNFLGSGQIERPQAAILYDPKDNFKNLFTWSGTAVKLVFYKLDFWLLLLLHLIFTICYNVADRHDDDNDALQKWPEITDDTMLVVGGILVFFMVFFNGQAYSRFFSQYFLIRKIQFNIQDLFLLTRTHVEQPVKQLTTVRLLHAAHYLGFAYMPQNRELPGFVEAVYAHLVATNCLTEAEAQDLRASDDCADPKEECILWFLQVLRAEMSAGTMKPPIYRAFEGKAHAVNDEYEELQAYALQPIPFAYYHLMTVICEIYLLVLSYVAIFITPWWSIGGYITTLISLLGLREAAACLSDPLGVDESDIPVFDMVAEQHYMHLRVLTTRPHQKKPLLCMLGFGSKKCYDKILEGLSPADFQEEAPEVPGSPKNHLKPKVDKGEEQQYMSQGERLDFWMQLASGEDNARLKKEFKEITLKDMEPPAESPDDDDDEAEDFEVEV